MKYLVDANLPPSLSKALQQLGYDSKHTVELPLGNDSNDNVLRDIARSEERVVITKDSDFLKSQIDTGLPRKLLLVRTGNLPNYQLLTLFESRIKELDERFEAFDFIELFIHLVVLHPPRL